MTAVCKNVYLLLVFLCTTQKHQMGSILPWWKATVNSSVFSHTLQMCSDESDCLPSLYFPPLGEPDAAVTYSATIFTFHFSTARSGRQLSRRLCDEITMSFSLGKELQSPGMKGAGLIGEMITCHGYKNGWSRRDSLRGNWREMEFFFFTFFPLEPL